MDVAKWSHRVQNFRGLGVREMKRSPTRGVEAPVPLRCMAIAPSSTATTMFRARSQRHTSAIRSPLTWPFLGDPALCRTQGKTD